MAVKRRGVVAMVSKRAELTDARPSRRRRFAAYSLAFACMLAMSLLLDLRRAAERRRAPKLQLTLPSRTSLQSLADEQQPLSVLSPPPTANTEPHVASAPTAPPAPKPPPPQQQQQQQQPPPPPPPPPMLTGAEAEQTTHVDGAGANPNPNLSEQELKDDVDQLIAHVDQQEAIEASQHANSTASAAAAAVASSSLATNASRVDAHDSPVLAANHSEPAAPAASKPAPVNASDIDVRLNSQQYFDDAQARLQRMLADSHTKALIDENELRTLQALQLQATRGDCEHASDRDATLFKTDAEAASNLDIERSDPLWGAWCLFVGSYKTDAMRDFVTKQQLLEHRVAALREKAPQLNVSESALPFDADAASLDDVMTPEQQSSLRANIDRIMSHLRDIDVRYLAALSLQAAFGDCAPYARSAEAEEGAETGAHERRVLKEPLLEQTATRREGAQWGAWCVLQGKKRGTAASQLTQRVDMLLDQLSKSEAEAVAAEGGREGRSVETREGKEARGEQVVVSAS